VGVVLGAVTVGIVGFGLWSVPLFACGNEVVERLPSPDGMREAVVFTRNCGATTDYSTQVSILPAGGVLPDRPGNTYVTAHPTRVEVTWEGSHVAVIRRAVTGTTEQAEVGGIQVRFLDLEF
jgi:hypothetical protein